MARTPDVTELCELVAAEPFVRALARDLVADEADEVVQQAYLLALSSRPDGLRSPRQWLARIVRNVAFDLRRGRRRRRDHEAAAARELTVSSADLQLREERRAEVVAAVDALPEPMRTSAVLRYYDGLAPRQIAQKLGVPVSTVWSRLHKALTLLRERLDREHAGDRRAWLLPFLGLANGALPSAPVCEPSPSPSSSTPSVPVSQVPAAQLIGESARAIWPSLAAGVATMTTKGKLGIILGLVTAGAIAILATLGEGAPTERAQPPRDAAAPARVAALDAGGADESEPTLTREAPADGTGGVVPARASTATGALRVRVVYGDERSVAAGVRLLLSSQAAASPRMLVTDAAGTARIADLEPGRFEICPAVNVWEGESVAVVAGEEAEVVVALKAGLRVDGVVVDAGGVPVADATVLVNHIGMEGDARPVTTTDANGRFGLVGLARVSRLGARAAGHAPSRLYSLNAKDGSSLTVRLELAGPGGAVEGRVFAADGEPLAGALVRVGTDPGETVVRPDGGFLRSAAAFAVRTDVAGRFRAFGIAPGEQRLVVIASGHSPWESTVTVPPKGTAVVTVRLDAGVRVTGLVRGADGQVVPGTRIEHGKGEKRRSAVADEQGRFELVGLPVGEFELVAVSERAGRATTTLTAVAGQELIWNPTLTRGLELFGDVVDHAGEPMANVMLIVSCRARQWSAMAQTDAGGRFEVSNCPAATTLEVEVHHRGYRSQRLEAVDPTVGRLRVRLEAQAPGTASVRGRVVNAAGLPLANATVMLVGESEDSGGGRRMTGPDGVFQIGPTIPGKFQLLVRANGHAAMRTAWRVLAAHETWEAGDVALSRGGHVEIAVTNPPITEGTRFWIRGADARGRAHVDVSKGMTRSAPLVAGDYVLGVRGPGVAAQALPVKVEDGRVTEVEVTLRSGVDTRFRVQLPPGFAGRRFVRLTIRVVDGGGAGSPGDLVTDRWRYSRGTGAIELAEALTPGHYVVDVRAESGGHGRSEFRVRAEPAADPVRVVLR
ncbi:MAG: sigma-70 family RNA polymerase sigma factor [bacterium]|nr:sigma-70 family RNA polymerase sigma factor [bacterium]